MHSEYDVIVYLPNDDVSVAMRVGDDIGLAGPDDDVIVVKHDVTADAQMFSGITLRSSLFLLRPITRLTNPHRPPPDWNSTQHTTIVHKPTVHANHT